MMELRGVGIDRDAHDALCDKWGVALAEARRRWSETTGEPPPSKPADIVRDLVRVLPEAELAKWPRTKTGGLTTKTSELARVAHLPAIQPLLRIKEVEQRITHFGSKLRQLVNPETGRRHPHYNVAGTKAGRWSASDPNVQQLPHDQAMRSIIVAASGNVLIGADYSQMELRAVAWFSGDSGMTGAFERGDDLHVLTAAAINGIDPAQVTTEQRTSAKAANFGLIYGSGAPGLAASAWKSDANRIGVDQVCARRATLVAAAAAAKLEAAGGRRGRWLGHRAGARRPASVPAGRACRRLHVLGQSARFVPATRAGRPVGQRRDEPWRGAQSMNVDSSYTVCISRIPLMERRDMISVDRLTLEQALMEAQKVGLPGFMQTS